MTDSVERSVERVGTPSVSASVERSYGRTNGRTYEESYSPTSDNNSSVTHARAYEISPFADLIVVMS